MDTALRRWLTTPNRDVHSHIPHHTGDKDPYTQWTHCEHIVNTDNTWPQCARWAHFDHIQNLPPNVAKMCVLNLFRICATTVATIYPAVT